MQNMQNMHNTQDNTQQRLSLAFSKIKALLRGCDSTIDTLSICKIASEEYPELRGVLTSYRDSLAYMDNIDLATKLSSLQSVNSAETRDDAITLKSKLLSNTSDPIFLKTLERIIARRKDIYVVSQSRNHPRYITKKCPHCNINTTLPDNTYYVVCGYTDSNRGYDWNGCCNDWCFNCGKMLCKNWERDSLHLESNRMHDDECCREHAKRHNKNYKKDYCHCIINSNINRKYEPELSDIVELSTEDIF